MRDRVHALLAERVHGQESSTPPYGHPSRGESVPFISTFHSLGVHIIKENAHLLGLTKHFAIADEHDAISIIKDSMKERGIDPKQHEPRKIKSIISKAKGDFITSESYANSANNGFQSIVSTIWRDYERKLKEERALDFDDLLLESVLILKKYGEIRKQYQQRWACIHIDEYQDTNEVQYEMTKLLVGPEENICVVGDTDQCVYSWRGASIKNILHFEKDYPTAKIVILEQNYRSTKNIIAAANSVIDKNQYRMPKNLFTENVTGEQISIYEAYDEVHEGEFVASTIVDLLKTTEPEEIAILYRANFQSRVLEEALLSEGIPYQVLGVKFFERKEVKDVLSYIRASYNRESLSDIKRIINTPARGIGKVTLVKLFSGMSSDLPATMQAKIQVFYSLLEAIREYSETHTPSETVKYVIEKSGLKESLEHGTSDEQERLENMRELVTLATKYDSMPQGDGLDKLLEDASLAGDQDTLMHKGSGVRMMTVHAAKGLEFKYVFITGLEQDLFPHKGHGGGRPKEDQEEERRLFYVALTRARLKLYLSYAQLRTVFGMKQVNNPSEFIADIPSELVIFEQGRPRNGERIIYI